MLHRPLHALRFCALDFESAGISRGSTDEPVQIGWASMDGATIDPTSLFVSHLQCEKPITWAAQKVHGITTADLAGAPSLMSLWPRVKAALSGAVVVAHGAGTEKRFLRAFPFHGFGPWLDTLVLAKKFLPHLPDHALSTICDHCGLTPEVSALHPTGRWHDALYDATACLAILRHLMKDGGLGECCLGELGAVS